MARVHNQRFSVHSYEPRKETYEGRDHLAVPVVMAREGVLNGALLTAEELGKYVQAWNGRPVPVLHPEQDGENVSANSPRVRERTIGTVFNTHADGDRLKAELWLDTAKARGLGYGELIDNLTDGKNGLEVSTGYFADAEDTGGRHRGVQYDVIHRNIRPDHLALLPGEIGACSWEDGCGVRANQSEDGALRRAWNVIAQRLGLPSNACACAGDCQCNGGQIMATEKTVAERVEALKANKAITPKQLQMLQDMEPEQMKMAVGIVESMLEMDSEPAEPEPEGAEGEDLPENMSVNSDEGREFIANQVKEGMRRERVLDKLAANSANAFGDAQLQAMSTDALKTYEQSIRPADYSGHGGFASNGAEYDETAAPLAPSRGVLSQPSTNTEQ